MNLSEFYYSKKLSNQYTDSLENQSIQHYTSILKTVRKINSSIKMEEVLNCVINSALNITGTYRGFIVLKDSNGNFVFKFGMDKNGKELNESSFRVCDKAIADVFNNGESIIIAGANNNDEKDYLNSCVILPINTVFCSPLIVKGEKIGVIYVDSPEVKNIKKLETTYTFEILAEHAAVAINNAKIHEELEREHRRSENAEKLKDDFITLISHEIRNPLNYIMTHAQLLHGVSLELLDKEYLESFDIIHTGGKRLLRSIELLLNTSEITSGNYNLREEEFNIDEDIISPILHEYQNKALEKKIRLNLNNRIKGNCKINADKQSIFLIFVHLIDNAVKFTNRGEVNINIYNDKSSDKLTVEINDTGIGIAPDYLPDIFKQFTQEETGYTRTYDGMGLGLALVDSYSRLNNLELTVDSEKNVGSKFKITF